jgi:hypothetical protein
VSALTVGFQGFVQVRLPTDPDPCDEPRGVSGWTRAVAGEPDLDRVLVLQDDDLRRVRRSHGPTVGVNVTSVAVDGVTRPGHPLSGGRVELLGDPKFEGRNWIVAADGLEPIDPLHVSVSRGSTKLSKRAVIRDGQGADVPFYLASPDQLKSRTPRVEAGGSATAEIFSALGIPDNPTAWRARRRAALETELAAAASTDETGMSALDRRIHDLMGAGVAVSTVGVRMRYRLDLDGPGSVHDPAGSLTDVPDVDAPWPVDFWVGGWDADALCMYLRGTLTVPLRSP